MVCCRWEDDRYELRTVEDLCRMVINGNVGHSILPPPENNGRSAGGYIQLCQGRRFFTNEFHFSFAVLLCCEYSVSVV